MIVTFVPNGNLQIDDCRIIFKNFAGSPTKFNSRGGERSFAVVIDDATIAEKMTDAGWNVKIREPRDPGDTPFMYITVKVNFNGRGPACYLQTGRKSTKLSEDTVECLDQVDIRNVSLDVRPYDWEVNGKTGRTAYLLSIEVEQEIDRFAARYAEEEYPEE